MRLRGILTLSFLVGMASCLSGQEILNADLKFEVVGPKGEKVGHYRIQSSKEDKIVTVIETIQAGPGGQKGGWKSTVSYYADEKIKPINGMVVTIIGDQPCMTGSLLFLEDTIYVTAVGYIDKRGNKIPEGKEVMQDKGPIDSEGIYFISSSAPIIGDILLKGKEEISGINFVEFPDDMDMPELLNIKDEYKLVKSTAADGAYTIKIMNSREEEIQTVHYEKSGQIKLISQGLMQFKLIKDVKNGRRN